MIKITKSILLICIISLFLLIGQAAATDIDSIKSNDMNGIADSNEIDNADADADSIENKDIDANSKNSDRNSFQNDTYLDCESLDDDISIKEEEEISIKEYDNERFDLLEEGPKDTDGIVMAGDNYSCGPASLATALNKLGLNLSLNDVSQHTNTSLNGTSMQSLIDAAKYYGFSALGLELDTESLKENYIVHLNIHGNEHWTLISKATDTHVFLADSTLGNFKLTINEFNSFFTKNAIAISKDKQIDLENEMISNQIKILDKAHAISISGKGMKRKIVGYKTVWKYGMIAKYGWVLRPVVSGGHVSFSQWKYVKGTYYVFGRYKVTEPIYKYYYVSDDSLTSAKIKKSKK